MLFLILCWILVGLLALVGVLGTLIPLLPGAVLILAAAFSYDWLIAPSGQGVGWVTLTGLTALTVLSYVVDLLAGILGAKKFGATKAGVLGGVLGLIVGLFFSLPGLILGPPLGVTAGEIYSGKDLAGAVRVAWGTVVGTAAGMFVRLGIAIVMVIWLAIAIFNKSVPA